jgi:hypothetical protein
MAELWTQVCTGLVLGNAVVCAIHDSLLPNCLIMIHDMCREWAMVIYEWTIVKYDMCREWAMAMTNTRMLTDHLYFYSSLIVSGNSLSR